MQIIRLKELSSIFSFQIILCLIFITLLFFLILTKDFWLIIFNFSNFLFDLLDWTWWFVTFEDFLYFIAVFFLFWLVLTRFWRDNGFFRLHNLKLWPSARNILPWRLKFLVKLTLCISFSIHFEHISFSILISLWITFFVIMKISDSSCS